MPASTPTLEAILAAIKTKMDAVPGIGTVFTSDHPKDDDFEFLDNEGFLDADTADVWLIDLRGSVEVEGPAVGEIYNIHSIWIRYWSIRTNDPDWSKKARELAEDVREALSGSSDIFRIGGQVQLFTPETVQIEEHGKVAIRGLEAEQVIFRTLLGLSVEARRWA
jgi:hypothetical protein